MPNTFGEGNLLNYNSRYRVLICQECKYAIQKSALTSHLLRHKIYRGERQRLLSSVAQIELLEPDSVPLPPAGSLSIDGLPIISGYRCTAIGCQSLCASSKRMRMHWSQSHGVSDPPDSCARSANLQTFFRGTKLKYFEVSPPTTTSVTSPVIGDERLTPQDELDIVSVAVPGIQTSVLAAGRPPDMDMDMLRYFHHFTTTTSLTLPAENHEPAKYWQIDVVAQALRLRWLMCGLLAISASHLEMLSDDETTKQVHRERSASFLQEFSAEWVELRSNFGIANTEEVKLGAQMICIQRCAQWTLESPVHGQGITPEPPSFLLQSFITTVQGCVDSNFALRSEVDRDNMTEQSFIRARNDVDESSGVEVPNNAPTALLERLRTLPYRMADALEKPENALEFFATMSAIDALVECCSLSYASDDMAAAWMGMDSWLGRLSDPFKKTLWHGSPAALIVLAHWLILVERVESYCWFLRGLSAKLIHKIVTELPKDNAIQSLVLQR